MRARLAAVGAKVPITGRERESASDTSGRRGVEAAAASPLFTRERPSGAIGGAREPKVSVRGLN